MSQILNMLQGGYYGYEKWSAIREWITPHGEMGLYLPEDAAPISKELALMVVMTDQDVRTQQYHIDRRQNSFIMMPLHETQIIAAFSGAIPLTPTENPDAHSR